MRNKKTNLERLVSKGLMIAGLGLMMGNVSEVIGQNQVLVDPAGTDSKIELKHWANFPYMTLDGSAGSMIRFKNPGTDASYYNIVAEGGLLKMRYNSGKGLVLDEEGYVGIGIDDPAYKLHVNGTGTVTQKISSTNGNAGLHLSSSSGAATFAMEGTKLKLNNGGSFGDNHLVIDGNGNVGIGRSNPGVKLDVYQGDLKVTMGNFANMYTTAGEVPLNVVGSDIHAQLKLESSTEKYTDLGTNKNTGDFNIYNGGYAGGIDFSIAPNGDTYVKGKLAVGDVSDASNNYMLFVEKGILTERVRVALTTSTEWADYVFSDDYELMPLNEVADFVEANNHLPNVPSADELVDSGIDMAKMDAKLMEKIEELTLYVIQLKKEVDELKTSNN